MRFIFVTILVACIVSGARPQQVQEVQEVQQVPEKPKPCNVAVRCSNVENLVWATDGKKCYVFKNGCFLFSANCQRRNEFKKVLKKVTKKRCQTMCNNICTEIFSPVCATYKGDRKTFGNPCRLDNYICRSGELYELQSNGECEPNPQEKSA